MCSGIMIGTINDNYFLFIFSNVSTMLRCFHSQRNKVISFEKVKAFIELMICALHICYTSRKIFLKISKSRIFNKENKKETKHLLRSSQP